MKHLFKRMSNDIDPNDDAETDVDGNEIFFKMNKIEFTFRKDSVLCFFIRMNLTFVLISESHYETEAHTIIIVTGIT